MRFMMLVKADESSESGALPSEQELAELGRFNEELVRAGVVLAGEGLHPTSRGARVRFSGERRTVIPGPFSGPGELLAGFWMIQAESEDEAVDWAKRIPFRSGEVEVRRVFEAADFGDDFNPELRDREERLRAGLAARG